MIQISAGKYIFDTVKVGDRGQVVIPKEARELFGIEAGDSLLFLGDKKKGLSIVKYNALKDFALSVLK